MRDSYLERIMLLIFDWSSQTLSVEFNHVSAGKAGLRKVMEDKGYVVVGEVSHPQGLANDFIFVHHSLHELIAASKEQ